MCPSHDNSYLRNKSGNVVREHLEGWGVIWTVCKEREFELRHDEKAAAKGRPGGSGFQTE